ncbi:MAG: hypothetical protein JWR17_413 [Pseudomonas sp.]|jgi:hypothetical protein|uniref:hypothetical protein n=1 Tax=Pseudomonas sp. TaxID=306 RepID=UPI0026190BF5|nr:hypothetical protein [Pseudomonas sp.]MDB6047667.1 hypothetical protein [Pseudomonas sp.]
MWKRSRPRSVEHDLCDAADNLHEAVRQLLDVTGDLIRAGNGGALETIASVIVGLQDDEVVLREHAATLKSAAGGRRATDKVTSANTKN